MRPRVLRTPSTWLRITREDDGAFVMFAGATGEREAFRAYKYPREELPTVADALELGAALVQCPPMMTVVSVPLALVDRLFPAEGTSEALERVRTYPVTRESYQLPVRDREAIRALLKLCERHVGAHVDPFHEAEAVNLAARLHRALGAV